MLKNPDTVFSLLTGNYIDKGNSSNEIAQCSHFKDEVSDPKGLRNLPNLHNHWTTIEQFISCTYNNNGHTFCQIFPIFITFKSRTKYYYSLPR